MEQCIEIGPGKGALTKKLIQIVRKPLLLLEKDETLLTQLHATIALALTKTDPEPISTPVHHSPDIQMHEPTIKMGDALQLDYHLLFFQTLGNQQQKEEPNEI